MQRTNFEQRRRHERMDREQRERHQLARLNQLLQEILPQNDFYAEKFAGLTGPLTSLDQLRQLPLTCKQELHSDHPAGFAANRTYPLFQYVRFHRTSGTRGRPLAVLDTNQDWQWWLDTWQYVLDAAGVRAADHVVMAFSFGPFIGFWSAYDACVDRGVLVAPSGGLTTAARLELIRSLEATGVFCTPSYALRMAEVAAEQDFDLRDCQVRYLVVAGEPGGSIPAVRQRIEDAWGARVVDHSGASEVGPWGYATADDQGLHVNEAEFIPEFLEPGSDRPARTNELAELVLTNLGRPGSPVIRYRTGDLVRPVWPEDSDIKFVVLQGGVLGRADDMLIIRGVNVFPSAIEAVLREIPEISEFRLTALRDKQMDELRLEVEDAANDAGRIIEALHVRLGLRVQVQVVPSGSLPRFEGKSQRFVDRRTL
jgi:phenylacetate-CoA ligase